MRRMRFFFFIPFIAAFLLCSFQSPTRADPPLFFETLPDIPIMAGLTENRNESILFDKPSGRIAGASAQTTTVPTHVIAAYYKTVLPELGWTPLDPSDVHPRAPSGTGRYVRDQERLDFEIESTPTHTILRMTVAPRQGTFPLP